MGVVYVFRFFAPGFANTRGNPETHPRSAGLKHIQSRIRNTTATHPSSVQKPSEINTRLLFAYLLPSSPLAVPKSPLPRVLQRVNESSVANRILGLGASSERGWVDGVWVRASESELRLGHYANTEKRDVVIRLSRSRSRSHPSVLSPLRHKAISFHRNPRYTA